MRRLQRHPGRRELLVFAIGYLTYFGVRAVTEGRIDVALRNAASLINFERDLGIAWEGAIQSVVIGSQLLQGLVNSIYIYGHWPVMVVAGVLLFRYRPDQYYTLRDICLITGLLGLMVFALFPVAPPRLTGLSVVDTITRGSASYRQLLPPELVNQYAAMPSFHAGWNLAVGIAVFRATRHWALRTFAVAMPVAMAFSVIATANHFVIDVVIGVLLVIGALTVRQTVLSPGGASGQARDDHARSADEYGARVGTPTVEPVRLSREHRSVPTHPLTGPIVRMEPVGISAPPNPSPAPDA